MNPYDYELERRRWNRKRRFVQFLQGALAGTIGFLVFILYYWLTSHLY